MGNHALLRTIKEDRSVVSVDGFKYTVVISWHDVPSISGDVLGLKFMNQDGAMDASIKQKGVNSYSIINALAHRATQMITPTLDRVAVIGFYLLTDGLDDRGPLAKAGKARLYNFGALQIHEAFKHELPLIARLKLEGAFGWVMTKSDIRQTSLFRELQKEFANQIEAM
jgi:hypothetical protein